MRLGNELPSFSGNPCGRCRECCTGKGLTSHNVTVLELELIAERVGEERLESFRRFLQRTGEIEVCPYFDEKIWGCGIYEVRPYSCRVFGHHRSRQSRLPEVCVFAGRESIFGVGEYLVKVPLAAELKELARSFWPYQREYQVPSGYDSPSGCDVPSERPEDTSHPEGMSHLNRDSSPRSPGIEVASYSEGDALDRVLNLMNQGRLLEALAEFEASALPSTPYVLYCLSLVFEGLERHGDACTALQVAIEQAPDCAPLWFRLGCNRYSLGQLESGAEAFQRTVELNPKHALAHALLGSHYLSQSKLGKARFHLAQSLALRPDPRVESWLQAASP